MPQYTKRQNDKFKLIFGEDIPGFVPKLTKEDSIKAGLLPRATQESEAINRLIEAGKITQAEGDSIVGGIKKFPTPKASPLELKPLEREEKELESKVGIKKSQEFLAPPTETEIEEERLDSIELENEIFRAQRQPAKDKINTLRELENSMIDKEGNILKGKSLHDLQVIQALINITQKRIVEGETELDLRDIF